MPGPALLPLASLNGLDLHQNPWNCSCGLKPLVTVTTNTLSTNTNDGLQWLGRQSVPQSISPVCSGMIVNCITCEYPCVPPAPAQLRHRPWSSLDPEDYSCKPVVRHGDRGSVVEVNR